MSVLSNTSVRFISGVPFDNSYAHTRWFSSRTEQYNYFTSFPNIQRTRNNFQKMTGRFAIDVSEDVHDMMKYDYMMFKNATYEDKWFFAFILNVEHLGRKSTRVYFEIDPIQTYMFDVEIKPSYVVREHEHGNPENVYPEGLQIGSDYEVKQTWDIKPYTFYFMVIVTKDRIDDQYVSDDLSDKLTGTIRGGVDPLNYYVYAIPRNATASEVTFKNSVGNVVMQPSAIGIRELLTFLSQSQVAVNNVVSMYLTDYIPLEITDLGSGDYRMANTTAETLTLSDDHFPIQILRVSDLGTVNFKDDLPDLIINVGNLFSSAGLANEQEPKLRYYPYTIIEMTDGRGNSINYKPEGLLGQNGDIKLRVMGGLTYFNNVSYGLQGYDGHLDRAGVLDNSIINTDPQDLAVLVDQAAAYLQGAKNSREAKRNTWDSQRTYQQIKSTISGASAAGNIVGGAIGMGAGALGLGYGINMLSTGLGNVAQSTTDFLQAGVDYQNRINEQNAMVEDLNNVPPSLQKQGNNPSFNIGYDMQGVRIRIKRVRPQYLDRVRDYLKLFGTKVNRLKMPNLNTRTHFNYVQTTMLNVQSPLYNDDVLRFKHIFDQGITLWHVNDMYNYNVTNGVR